MDMTATTPNIQARIATERKRLFDEQALQIELEKERLAPLEAGNDEVLDLVEEKIAKSIEREERTKERLALLERRLKESKQTDENARLDEIAAAAHRSHDRAALLLKKYPKAARDLASLLSDVKTCEAEIEAANIVLTAAQRPTIASADPKRFRITGHMGLVLDIVGLHQIINLPNEGEGPSYWDAENADDRGAEIVRAAFGVSRNDDESHVVDAVTNTKRGE